MSNFSDFTGLFSLSKTLRFELKPVGKTLENIEKKGLLAEDEKRAESYKKVKKLIDEYHKTFIEKALSNLTEEEDKEITEKKESKPTLKELLNKYFEYYNGNQKDELVTCAADLRKHIADVFKKKDTEHMFKKDFIKNELPAAAKNDEDRKSIGEFNDFTTYFTGFNENRKNMYSADEKSTAIAYRLINENLPKFIDNKRIFERISQVEEIKSNIEELQSNLSNELNGRKIADFFEIMFYGSLLTQSQIEIYNDIVGGLNQYTNLYNHQQSEKKDRLPKFKPLFKQILSDRDAISWLPDEFENDNDMLQSIEKCYQDLNEQVFNPLKTLLGSIKDFDLEHIYLPNDLQLTEIAQKHFGSWSVIRNAVVEDLKASNPQKRKEDAENYEKRMEKLHDSYSIAYLNGIMQGEVENFKPIEDYFEGMGAEDNDNGQKLNHFARIKNAYTEIKTLLNTTYPEGKSLSQDKVNVEKIKNLLDAIKDLQHFVKPLLGSGTESEKDNRFYGDFAPLWETLDQITPLYNMVRNRMTQKAYSDEKIKLNFDTPTLLNGWPDAQANSGAILKDDKELYYLVILDSKYRTCLNELEPCPAERCEMAIMKYLQGGDMGKNVQNLMRIDGITRKVNGRKEKEGALIGQNVRLENAKNTYLPIEINEIRLKQSYLKSSPLFNKKDLARYIEYYIPLVREYYSDYQFSFRNPSEYESFVEFTDHINQQAYQIQFDPISKEELLQMVDEGKIYLFQIYNKDFSPFSKGRPNMHTLYWKALFDERNLADVVYKLNGEAEVFFRKHSLEAKPTHPANQPIANKNAQNEKKESTFAYDLIKDRRYTVDKFQFHVPITMNFKAAGINNINSLVNTYLKESNATHIIGIDRGERHLLYLSLIDLQGNIVEQYSLNEIVNEYNGNTYRTNYHNLLDAKEKERNEARRSWQTIENIKELKEGYMSQVVHKIAELMVKYNAIVVLEDLNPGFMRGRQKVEKQVYQKFEKMLIDKLNYLVDKKLDAGATGGVLNAYQLTNKFESFQKMGKQNGFLFYIPAWNTSKMDPTTGFVNLFDTRYENMEKAKAFFGKFDSIRFNSAKGWFELAFDYNNFTTKAEGTQTKWTLCTYGTRVETKSNPEKNNKFDSVEFDLTERIKELFAKYKLDLNGNLKEQICNQTDAAFFKELLHLLHLTLQMRNSITGTKTDYLISPVINAKGEFYDSRVCGHNLPENADANGAYNIARKGLWVVEQIKHADDLTKIKLAISNKEWLRYAQGLK